MQKETDMRTQVRIQVLVLLSIVLLTACTTGTPASGTPASPNELAGYERQAVPHTWASLLVPAGWVMEYDGQGNTRLASAGENFFYLPDKSMDGALIQMFVSDAPRAQGEAFDVLKLAQAFAAKQNAVTQ